MTPPFPPDAQLPDLAAAPVQPTPEPDTGGEVEALAKIIFDASDWDASLWNERAWTYTRMAQRVLASDWLADRLAEERAEVVSGVRAWCAINEIAAPPLDWAGLGEFLTHVEGGAR